KALRQERKQTQKAMGELLGCTASNYQKIEYGEVNLPISSLMTLADYFGVTTDYLLGRSDRREG
ncbi:MAG TPA: helix-turn-helix domain-containing protein, partial [Candidatus Intestinimonas pullistercoris]|nr:helix-turn-helix domain-containing protein [Candidatus Intestinimonas pullistercoris]